MINVKLKGDFILSETDIHVYNYAKSLEIDAWLTIKKNDVCIYDDWVCPLELYYQIAKWKDKLNESAIIFDYISDDNSINPIFSISIDGSKCLFKNGLEKKDYIINYDDIINIINSYEYEIIKRIR